MNKMKIQTLVLTALIVAGSLFSANAQDASTILKKNGRCYVFSQRHDWKE